MGDYLSRKMGQQFIIDNRPGAGNNIGTEAVVTAPPDGYTVLLVNPANGINTTLYKKLPFNFVRDIAPVAGLIRVPNVMVVNPDVPAKTVREFIDYAKANPGKINMASSGLGTSVHLSGELFMAMTGVKMVHVPYRGAGPALTDLISGRVHVLFDNLPSSVEHIRDGKLRALAVTTKERSKLVPEFPPAAEAVPGYEFIAWFGLFLPAGAPAGMAEQLHAAVAAVLAAPDVKERYATLGMETVGSTPAEFQKFMAEDLAKWGRIIKELGITAEG